MPASTSPVLAAAVRQSLQQSFVIGHRGLAGRAPENTLAAFAAASDAGIRWVELDAKLCASGELVVFHDNTIDRTSDGHGRVQQLPWSRLRELDAGGWFAPAFAGARIPLLREVLAFCADHGMAVNIELKPNPVDYVATARAVAELLQREHWLDRLPLLASSFSRQSLAAIQRYLPALPRGFLLERRRSVADILTALATFEAISFHYDDALIDRATIDAVRATDREVLVWTVNTQARAEQLWRDGVCAVFSDQPLSPPKLSGLPR